ncbi:hypothetical protein [Methylorubrum extorquens]|uniref:Uncharacterized protein n=1 Tax=Methylorubrum extorquens (strain ATCC 14718 / DSM 1338 / JCM 2805 / NCIMB 9133 / AM1) TaxID=272630 RepID=C5B0R1_METEA|nr:hypothetical protein [Methylorubrum extorquens]ACS41648.1 Hypothetical protein MexAM1_META1p3966 [Methylorubrum extorquens AM1]MCP1545339.1 hypothetical protein [Methylorubrum extorquens]MCP1587314.1 hypothetical protein [Methylorubrum extorquens]
MSPRRLTACRIFGSLGLAAVLVALAVIGANAVVAAHHGDLFPPMHWVGR